jgi:hypothetical protein
MVSLSPTVAKEVLRVVNLGKEEVRRLTERSDVPSESAGRSKVRKCFLHFLMAFLVDKEANTIQILMAKEGIFFAYKFSLLAYRNVCRFDWKLSAWPCIRCCPACAPCSDNCEDQHCGKSADSETPEAAYIQHPHFGGAGNTLRVARTNCGIWQIQEKENEQVRGSML